MKVALILAFAVMMSVAHAQAATASLAPAAHDARIRHVLFNPESVVPITAYLGFQMMVEFAPGEHIRNVSIGDSSAWQLTPNRDADKIFIKPLRLGAVTNMTVVTELRAYVFDLGARKPLPGRSKDMVYVLRFEYPQTESTKAQMPAPPERRNISYTYEGSRNTLPALVFDDGQSTYFQFPDAAQTPALFVVQSDGAESIANYSVRDGFVVVHEIAPRFVLRNGKNVTTIVNQGWAAPMAGDGAPKPTPKKVTQRTSKKVVQHWPNAYP